MSPETPKSGGPKEPEKHTVASSNLLDETKQSKGRFAWIKNAFHSRHEIPIAGTVIGKFEIAYNQLLFDRHEKKAVARREKIRTLDTKNDALSSMQKEIKEALSGLQENNLPGATSLELKLAELEKQKQENLNKRDKHQTKLEERENKAKLYANTRDRIAQRFIDRYEAKLEPMEHEVERLKDCRDDARHLLAALEDNYKEKVIPQIKRFQEIKKTIEDFRKRL